MGETRVPNGLSRDLRALLLQAEVAGLARYAEIPAHIVMIMASPSGDAGHKAQALFRRRNSLHPRHPYLPPQKKRKVQPMCPVRNINYVSGRSTIIDALVPRLKRSDQPPQDPFR